MKLLSKNFLSNMFYNFLSHCLAISSHELYKTQIYLLIFFSLMSRYCLQNFLILHRYDGNQLWAFKIKGSAFLWHQVRCMVAVLLMIGQDLESPDVCNIFPTDLLVS